LQPKVEQRFGVNLHLLSARYTLSTRSRGGARQGPDGCSLAAASQRSDESAKCTSPNYFLCCVAAPAGG
jgi:hypothetical protein